MSIQGVVENPLNTRLIVSGTAYSASCRIKYKKKDGKD